MSCEITVPDFENLLKFARVDRTSGSSYKLEPTVVKPETNGPG